MLGKLRGWLVFNLRYLRGKTPWDTGISPPELLDYLAQHSPGRALDLGCGTGTNVLAMARRGWSVTGIDFAFPAVRAARSRLRAAHAAADIRQGDVTNLRGLAGPYDFALDLGCFHNLPAAGRASYRQGLEQLLGPGAHFLLYGFLRQAGGNEGAGQGALRGIGASDLAAFEPGFKLVWRKDGEDNAGPGSRGSGHASTWVLFERV